MRRIDDYLIDQVCQSVVDRLPGGLAPTLLGRHLILAGAALCSVALALLWRHEGALWTMGFGLAAVATSIYKAFEAGNETAEAGVAPITRLRDLPIRVLNLAFAVTLIALAPFYGEWLLALSQVLLATGLYTAACRRPPPAAKAAVTNRRSAPPSEAASPG